MFTRRSLLSLAVVVLALAAAAHSGDQLQCNSDSYGTITNNPVYLQQVILPPGQADWDVQIPADQACRNQYGPNSYPLGVSVQACDEDVPPVVTVLSLNEALVSRRGSLQSVATVDTVVYCQVTRVSRPNVDVGRVNVGMGRLEVGVGRPDVGVGRGRPAIIAKPAQRPRISVFVRPHNN